MKKDKIISDFVEHLKNEKLPELNEKNLKFINYLANEIVKGKITSYGRTPIQQNECNILLHQALQAYLGIFGDVHDTKVINRFYEGGSEIKGLDFTADSINIV